MEALRALRELLPALQRFIFLVAEVFLNSESLISVFVFCFCFWVWVGSGNGNGNEKCWGEVLGERRRGVWETRQNPFPKKLDGSGSWSGQGWTNGSAKVTIFGCFRVFNIQNHWLILYVY